MQSGSVIPVSGMRMRARARQRQSRPWASLLSLSLFSDSLPSFVLRVLSFNLLPLRLSSTLFPLAPFLSLSVVLARFFFFFFFFSPAHQGGRGACLCCFLALRSPPPPSLPASAITKGKMADPLRTDKVLRGAGREWHYKPRYKCNRGWRSNERRCVNAICEGQSCLGFFFFFFGVKWRKMQPV